MRQELRKLYESHAVTGALTSDLISIQNQADVTFVANFSGTPRGDLTVQGRDINGSFFTLFSQSFSGVPAFIGQNIGPDRYRELRMIFEPDSQVQINTLTLAGALVANNVVGVFIDDVLYSVTYASSSDETLQALATAIALAPGVDSAVVTVVGGDQTGVDDRVITVTFDDYALHSVRDSFVVGGAGQVDFDVAQSQDSSAGILDAGFYVKES